MKVPRSEIDISMEEPGDWAFFSVRLDLCDWGLVIIQAKWIPEAQLYLRGRL
jgi:hypothetical protein